MSFVPNIRPVVLLTVSRNRSVSFFQTNIVDTPIFIKNWIKKNKKPVDFNIMIHNLNNKIYNTISIINFQINSLYNLEGFFFSVRSIFIFIFSKSIENVIIINNKTYVFITIIIQIQ